jgi:hypothetical protein
MVLIYSGAIYYLDELLIHVCLFLTQHQVYGSA